MCFLKVGAVFLYYLCTVQMQVGLLKKIRL